MTAAPVPYDMRHSFATAVHRKTGGLKAVKELLGHSTLRMTERYMLAAVPERQRAASRSLSHVGPGDRWQPSGNFRPLL